MAARELASQDEELRLAALASYAIVDTAPEEEFDWIAQFAARICEAPLCAITFIDRERQWFKASHGMDLRETGRNASIGVFGFKMIDVMVVPDTLDDPRFAGFANVRAGLGIRSYAGAPLVTHDGFALGMLSVMDTRPRTFPGSSLDALRNLATQVMLRLENRRQQVVLQQLQAERALMAQSAREQADLIEFAGRLARLGGLQIDLVRRSVTLSDEARALFGTRDKTLSLDRVKATYAPEYQQKLTALFRQCVAERRGFDEEMELVTPEGKRLWVRTIVQPVADVGSLQRIRGAIQDISDRKATEQRLEFDARTRMGVLAILQDFASSSLTLDQQMVLMAERTKELMQASGAEVDLLEGEELICHGAAGSTTRGTGFSTSLDGLSGLSVLTGKGQVSLQTEGDIRVNQAICRQLGVRCVAVAPMTLDDKVVGVIRVTYDRPNVFGDREMSILLMLCAAMGGVIERRRIGEALRKSEERYRLLFERNPHAMYVYDPRTLKILAVNDSAVQRYGYTAQEFLGMAVSDLWPREGNPTVSEQSLRSIPLFAKTADLRRRHVRKDGSLMDVELSADGIVYDGKPARLVLIVDVSERVNAEREVVRMARAQQMLSACNESLIRASDRQALLDKVCQIAVDIGGYRAAWVAFARDDADKTVEPVAFAGIGSEAIRGFPMSWAEHLPAGQGTVGRAIRSQTIVAAHDISQEPPSKMWSDVLRVFDVRGVISLPLRDRDRAFGVLGLYSTEPVYPGSDELVLMEELANDLAFGITHLGAREEQRKLQEAVLRVAAAVTNQVGARFFDDLVRNLTEAVEGSAGLIAHLTPGGTVSARAVSTYAVGRPTEPFDFVLADSPFESVLREEMLFVRSGLKNRYPGRFAQYDGFAGCRLNDSNGNPIGLLAVFFEGPLQSAGFVENALKIFAARAASELERQQFDAQLHRAAFYDALTELPNRRLFLSRLQEALDAPAARAQCGAVLFLNLDNFAIVNKTLGHANADRLLQQVSERLGLRLHGSGLLARLGGDEFLVLLRDLGHEPVSVKREASLVAQGLLEALSLPFGFGSYEQTISACVGIVTFGRGDPASPDELLQQVDLALAGAKAGGRNSIRFFDPALQLAVAERAKLEAELSLALAEGQLELHYQPQVARDGHILGVEALLRWRHPTRGMISPANFIPLAEETGLIVSIGQWVIESACTLLNHWSRRPQTAALTVSVNVSAAQFQQRSFVSQVDTAVTSAAANPRLLKLELTESVLVQDMEAVIEKMHALRALGVGFSMDDFGTGYSSLSYLKRMPLDQLKIDQSFVRDLLTDVNDATIAKTIIALAHNLGLMVIAEGVEQEEQRDLLFSHDCDAFQGYLFSRPVPLNELEKLLD